MPGENSDIISRLMPDQDSTSAGNGARSAPSSPGEQRADISVEPSILRTAAGEARGIAGDLKAPTSTAMRDSQDAVDTLHGWQLGSLLGSRLDGWEHACRSLMDRVGLTGSLINDAANGFEWTDDAINASFPGVKVFDPSDLEKVLGFE